jgi:acyl-CoA synthetase (AMP-forming)/AMP-acid ligase II
MLSSAIKQAEALTSDAIVNPDGAFSWRELAGLAAEKSEKYRVLGGRRVGLCLQATAEGLATLAALDCLCCDTFLFSSDGSDEQMRAVARGLGLGAFLASDVLSEIPGESKASGHSSVTILTSGSSGQPKAVRHSWESLARPVRRASDRLAPRWLLTFRPNLYAGLQVILQCVLNGGTLAAPRPGMSAPKVAEFAASARVQFVSATPSYWRWLLTFADAEVLRRLGLLQITLGGEVVPQEILDRLRELFPGARLVHIYATTELGRCFSVTDGKAGFPTSFLDQRSPDGVELQIINDELCVRSANRMQGYDGDSSHSSYDPKTWFPTGDLVGVVGNRVHFLGRASDMINVGGNKVHPLEIERLIRAVPGVVDVRVYGRKSSITGQLVECEVVAAEGADAAQVQEAVQSCCLNRLASHQRPRTVRMVSEIGLSQAGKRTRGLVS